MNVVNGVVDSGHTSAASVPLALTKLTECGDIPSGSPVPPGNRSA
ncbi:hypothetical protein [Streptomyces buecherae]